MNDDLQKQLAELLAKMTNTVGDVATFAGNQLPPLVQEKILYGRVVDTAMCLTAFVICIWCVRCFYKAWRLTQAAKAARTQCGIFLDYEGAGQVIASVCVGAAAFGWFLLAIDSTITVWLAPRLYIVEWLRGMVSYR